jgi:hypothetical protein
MRAGRTPVRLRVVAVVAAAVAASAILSACQPEPSATPTASEPSPSASPTQTSPAQTPSASPSPTADAGFELPAMCEDIYSAKMLASLEAANPPLNDPGVTMDSSQNTDALELLGSGIPTIRCSWGKPSEYGLATNISIVTYAGDGLWCRQEDIYNPLRFVSAAMKWCKKAAALGTLPDEAEAWMRQMGGAK